MSEDARDILIEMRADMKHVREKVDHLSSSDSKQWEKLDSLNSKTEGHEKTLNFLVRGFWSQVTGVLAVIGGLFVWLVKGDN